MLSFRFRRLGASAGLVCGLLGLVGPGPAQGQAMAPTEAPAEWVRYAGEVTQAITGWLEDDSEVATAVGAHLEQTRPADTQPAPSLVLKVWIEPDGRVPRADFDPFSDESANARLRALIVGRTLAPPPAGMLLPLRLSVQPGTADAQETATTDSDGHPLAGAAQHTTE